MITMEGINTIPIKVNVHNQDCGRMVHPAIKNMSMATGTRLRLKLSKNFHLDNPDNGFFLDDLLRSGTLGINQCNNCQSPRIQRYLLLTSAK